MLNEYTTKEKDAQKGISRIPLEMCRMSEEDLVNLEQFKQKEKPTDSSESGSNSGHFEIPLRAESISGIPLVEMTEELEENIRHRGKSYLNFKTSL